MSLVPEGAMSWPDEEDGCGCKAPGIGHRVDEAPWPIAPSGWRGESRGVCGGASGKPLARFSRAKVNVVSKSGTGRYNEADLGPEHPRHDYGC